MSIADQISAFWEGLIRLIASLFGFGESFFTGSGFYWLRVFLVLATIALAVIIVLIIMAINDLVKAERKKYSVSVEFDEVLLKKNKVIEVWQSVGEHMKSDSESDWKLAVLEADTILDSLTKDLGYPGENVGDRLKIVPQSEMYTLDEAWRAHKLRNRIAHGRADNISRDEIARAIALYEQVFREFEYI